MELEIFVDNILTNNNKPCTAEDVKKVCKYIYDKAKKEANGQSSIGIDDETVKQWVLEYDPSQQVTEPEEVTIAEKKIEYKPIEPKPKKIKKDENCGTWGTQESLF